MDKGRSIELGEKNITGLIWKFFWPAFIGVSVNALYNIVDRIFIGRGVGALALSGLSVVFPIMILVAAFGMLIGIGAGVRISINMGKKEFNVAERVLGNGFVLMIIVGIFVTVIGFIVKTPMLRSFGANDQTIGYAQDYLNIILLGSVFQVVGFSMNNIIRSEGSPRNAMFSMIVCAGVNVVLNPIFIFGLGMGVKGSALATVISQFILMFWVISHFLSKRSVLRLRLENMKLDWSIIWQIVTIGMAPFAMQIAGSLVQATYNTQLIRYGEDVAVGAMGIVNSVVILIVMAIVSINMAIQPIIGYNFGAGNYGRVRQAWNIGIKAGTIIAIIAFILVELFPGSIIHLFNHDDPQLYAIGVKGIRIFVLMLPLVGFQVICSNYFQSIGNAKISLFLTLLRQVIVLLPLLTILPMYWGITGIWMASPISDFIATCVVFIFFRIERMKLHQLEMDFRLQ
ncbi:MAG: MATE family efflux transporter [Bacteroidia bacterium]|nr:MATE family efflux transporter [Bacteroidia bacterium]